jgi:D-threonate/D-erythronate kinase
MAVWARADLRLIADDVTGALDSAAPFASSSCPVRLAIGDEAIHGSVAISSESRDLDCADALERTKDAWTRLCSGASRRSLFFKKVDSVLRGHPLEETLLVMRLGGFRRCVFAPAFPEMGRITRNLQHLVRAGSGYWEPTFQSDLRFAFAALGIEVCDAARGEGPVVVLNAETQDELAAAVADIPDKAEILWAGSRGLAEALVPDVKSIPWPSVVLFVIGTTHPSTRAQVLALQGRTKAFPQTGPVRIERGVPLLLDPVPGAPDAVTTRSTLAQAVQRIEGPVSDWTICVVGGDTLSTLLGASGASGLNCIGEIASGLPCSKVQGGLLHGATLVSKSGGFGAADLLRKMLNRDASSVSH